MRETMESVKARFGDDTDGMAKHLARVLNEQHDARDEDRTAANKITELEAKVPAEGSVVLTPDQAKVYQAYTALELKPDEIKSKIQTAEQTAADLAKERKAATLRKVADTEKWKPEILARYGGDLEYDFQEVDEGGVKHERAFVKAQDGTLKRASEHLTDLLPALQAEPVGTRWTEQHSGGGPPADNIDAAFQRRQEARNPASTA